MLKKELPKREQLLLRFAGAILFGLLVAGCDKCGDRVKFNAPSLPKACGDTSNPTG